MSGEFTYVSRPRSPRKAQRKDKFKIQETSVEWIDERFRDSQERFQQSVLCKRYIEAVEEVISDVGVPERFVCLGLGGFVDRPPGQRRLSEVQLALFLELNKTIKAPMIACDPSFDKFDKEFLLTKGVAVEDLEEQDYDSSSSRTFFYLPHCERWLNDRVLAVLMRTSSLHNAILIMNDIRKYDTKKENTQAIAAVLNDKFVELKELEPEKKDDFRNVFTGLSLIWPSEITKK